MMEKQSTRLSDDSGFSMALAWSTFDENFHTITLKVHRDTDRIRTIVQDFTVVRFEDVLSVIQTQ